MCRHIMVVWVGEGEGECVVILLWCSLSIKSGSWVPGDSGVDVERVRLMNPYCASWPVNSYQTVIHCHSQLELKFILAVPIDTK
jgi:hypothetical protein